MLKHTKTIIVSVALTAAIACAAIPLPANAMTFSSLSQLQRYILSTAPEESMASGTHYLEIEGKILDITWTGASNHYNITLTVSEEKAMKPIGTDSPQLTVHFRLHKDEPPFAVGDTITVFGALNEMYSSAMNPFIMANYINGSDDF